jgi:hypothetical protein
MFLRSHTHTHINGGMIWRILPLSWQQVSLDCLMFRRQGRQRLMRVQAQKKGLPDGFPSSRPSLKLGNVGEDEKKRRRAMFQVHE